MAGHAGTDKNFNGAYGALIERALDFSGAGILIHDREMILYTNAILPSMIEVPAKQVEPGTKISDMWEYCAQRGDYGHDHTPDELVKVIAERALGAHPLGRAEASARRCRRERGGASARRASALPEDSALAGGARARLRCRG